EDGPIGRFLYRLLDHDEETPHGNVSPLVVVTGESPCAPHQRSLTGECAERVNRLAGGSVDIQVVLLDVVDFHDRFNHVGEADVRGRLPNAPSGINGSVNTGHGPAGRQDDEVFLDRRFGEVVHHGV